MWVQITCTILAVLFTLFVEVGYHYQTKMKPTRPMTLQEKTAIVEQALKTEEGRKALSEALIETRPHEEIK